MGDYWSVCLKDFLDESANASVAEWRAASTGYERHDVRILAINPQPALKTLEGYEARSRQLANLRRQRWLLLREICH